MGVSATLTISLVIKIVGFDDPLVNRFFASDRPRARTRSRLSLLLLLATTDKPGRFAARPRNNLGELR
jgi:hypothetical protein